MPSENEFFLDEEATRLQGVLEVLGGQVPGLYGGTIFLGGVTHLGVQRGIESKMSIFPHISDSLKGTQHSLI